MEDVMAVEGSEKEYENKLKKNDFGESHMQIQEN